jgi:hypothetical protein
LHLPGATGASILMKRDVLLTLLYSNCDTLFTEPCQPKPDTAVIVFNGCRYVQCGVESTSRSGYVYCFCLLNFSLFKNASIAYTGCYGLGLIYGPGIITFPEGEMSSSEFSFIFKSWFGHIKAAFF